MPLISFFLGEASWYLLTSRRVVGAYSGRRVEAAALDVQQDDFGGSCGHGGVEVEVMTLWPPAGGQVATAPV